jgi:hypothetical protein
MLPRMRREFSAVCVAALVVSAAACSAGGDDDDDAGTTATPGPTDLPSKTFALNASGFQVAHVGETALVRVFVADPPDPAHPDVVFCGTSTPIGPGGVFSISSVPAAVLSTNLDYTVELFANVSGGTSDYETNSENPGNPDHIYVLALDDVQTNVDIDFPHGIQAPASSFTWFPTSSCPGTAP